MASILKVDTIKHKDGTTALEIDSSGRITQPEKPAFIVSLKSASLSAATSGIVIFDHIVKQNGSGYSTSTGQFTAPVDGFYKFGHSVLLEGVGSSDDGIHLRYRVNSVTNDDNTWLFERIDGAAANGSPGYQGYINCVGSVVLYLEAGDTADLYWTSTGSIGVHANTNGTWSRMYGYLVS